MTLYSVSFQIDKDEILLYREILNICISRLEEKIRAEDKTRMDFLSRNVIEMMRDSQLKTYEPDGTDADAVSENWMLNYAGLEFTRVFQAVVCEMPQTDLTKKMVANGLANKISSFICLSTYIHESQISEEDNKRNE